MLKVILFTNKEQWIYENVSDVVFPTQSTPYLNFKDKFSQPCVSNLPFQVIHEN